MDVSNKKLEQLLSLLSSAEIIDLSQPYYPGIPHHPAHPPFLFSLSKQHGDYEFEGGASSAAEVFTLGGHVGTHIDGLGHFSYRGYLHGGIPTTGNQSVDKGLRQHSIDNLLLVAGRGVLLDVAAYRHLSALPADDAISAVDLQETAAEASLTLQPDDIVLIRTGWGQYWKDPGRYINRLRAPGPTLEAIKWLAEQRPQAVGSDTIAFEKIPSASMPCHRYLLVERGIYIMEALNLETLSQKKIYEFLFLASPLRIRGATGSPVRALALIP